MSIFSNIEERLEVEIANLRAENKRLKEKLSNLVAALPDTRKLLLAREDALGEL